MHKTYIFLLSRYDFDPDLKKEELAREAVSWFEEHFLQGSDYEDEWYTSMALITDEGDVVDLAPRNEHLGICEWTRKFHESAGPNERLQQALRLGVQIAATEMGLYGYHTIDAGDENEGDQRIDAACRQSLIDSIMTEIPQKLAVFYAEAIGKPRMAGKLNDYWYNCRVRKELALQFEEFCLLAIWCGSHSRGRVA